MPLVSFRDVETKPVDYRAFVYPELLRKVQPAKVNYTP
jgi:hypothetical protein